MMRSRLLTTKLHIPPLRAANVPRLRLQRQLTAGLNENRKLTLVSAPAGYGKTTLIVEWIHSFHDDHLKVAWLSLDQADNDPARFLSYWLAAFQQIMPSVQERIQPLLDLPKLPPVPMLLDELLNELAAFETPVVLVLEDYHLIDNQAVHQALEYFLDHQPARVHVVLITRHDPPLPLPRLRARGQMTEIRMDALRFTPEEVRQFFVQSMNLHLPEESADTLGERTEGWAVGLQLAGLALQNLADPREFIESFRGSHRYVLDYLAEEVIRQQGNELQTFLVQTSILDRFNADICCALTGREDAQVVIEHLEQSNLFVVPLDNERTWYRYHHLFSDYLRVLLSKMEQTDLYKKASAWHEANDLMEEAVHYALLSGDTDFAAGVVMRAFTDNTTWSSGKVAMLSSWLDALPMQAFINRPQLSLSASRVAYLSGNLEQAENLISLAEQALMPLPAGDEVGQMLALAALYRGAIASARGEAQQAIEQITFAQSRIAEENHLAHARGFYSLGVAYETLDENELAVQNYIRSSDEAQAAGVLFLAVHARCAAAQVQIKQGRLYQAEQTCQAAVQLARGALIPPLGLAWIVLGNIALERNDLAAAGQLLQDGIALSRKGGLVDNIILGLSLLIRLYVVQGDTARALEAREEAGDLLESFGLPLMMLLSSTYLARLQFHLGQKQAAEQWAAAYRSNRAALSSEFADLTLARILLETGEEEEIQPILQPILDRANRSGRMQTCIEVMLLLALFYRAKENRAAALDWLEKSLQLAAPEGYACIFLSEGQPLMDLLPQARKFAPEFVDTLLALSQPERTVSSAPVDQLPEPLSEQEKRVLQLIVAGKSNREIAAELVISVGTAKWHVHNVLQKLGVSNRPQAIARARTLGF